MKARVLKLYIRILHEKIFDLYFFLSELSPIYWCTPLKNSEKFILARYIKKYLSKKYETW